MKSKEHRFDASQMRHNNPIEKDRTKSNRTTQTIKVRRYRITKINPRKPKTIIIIDRGKTEEQYSLFYPHTTKLQVHTHKKEPNPDLMRINIGEISLVIYKRRFKGLVYDKDRMYCGSFEKHDLKNAFTRIGAVLKALKNENGYSTVLYNTYREKKVLVPKHEYNETNPA